MRGAERKSEMGFTLIEMIVSLALFSVVVTISVGALLSIISANEQLQEEKSVLTNLSFAIDSMTREIRTGEHYYCGNRNDKSTTYMNDGTTLNMFNDSNNLDTIFSPADDTSNCYNGNPSNQRFHGLVFSEGGGSLTGIPGGRILYYYDNVTDKIYRRIGNQAAQSIVSSNIRITDMRFFVSGAQPLSDNDNQNDQAAVTIFIEAVASTTEALPKTYHIQTTVTQRALDL